MIGLARHKREKAVGGPLWAACGCSLLIAFSISAGRGAQQPTAPHQRATARQDPAQQPAPTPQQQPSRSKCLRRRLRPPHRLRRTAAHNAAIADCAGYFSGNQGSAGEREAFD